MLITHFQDVYDLFFAEIGQNPVKFLSSAVALEFIDSNHLRKLNGLVVRTFRKNRMTVETDSRSSLATEE